MNEHLHASYVPGCFRCDLSRDEVDTLADEAMEEVAQAIRQKADQLAKIRRQIDELLAARNKQG